MGQPATSSNSPIVDWQTPHIRSFVRRRVELSLTTLGAAIIVAGAESSTRVGGTSSGLDKGWGVGAAAGGASARAAGSGRGGASSTSGRGVASEVGASGAGLSRTGAVRRAVGAGAAGCGATRERLVEAAGASATADADRPAAGDAAGELEARPPVPGPGDAAAGGYRARRRAFSAARRGPRRRLRPQVRRPRLSAGRPPPPPLEARAGCRGRRGARAPERADRLQAGGAAACVQAGGATRDGDRAAAVSTLAGMARKGTRRPERGGALRTLEEDAVFANADLVVGRQLKPFDAGGERVGFEEGDDRRPDRDLVAVAEGRLNVDALPVYPRAGACAGITDEAVAVIDLDPRVHARDGGVVNDEVIHRPPADEDAMAKQRRAAGALKLENQNGHLCYRALTRGVPPGSSALTQRPIIQAPVNRAPVSRACVAFRPVVHRPPRAYAHGWITVRGTVPGTSARSPRSESGRRSSGGPAQPACR